MDKVLLIEPYYAGSHRQLIDLLHSELNGGGRDVADLVTMTGKKWHWRARTSALHVSQIIPKNVNYRILFASSVLPLHELLGLRPDLQKTRKVLYFHENQLIYPVRKVKDRDFQYGYNQILSCITADEVLFNSNFNMDSFLSNLNKFFKVQPDYRPKNLLDVIAPKCRVLYFPLCFDSMKLIIGAASHPEVIDPENTNPKCSSSYRILWPHRWEYDKNPELFFSILYKLVDEGITNFRLSILGENFTDNLEIFTEAKIKLGSFIDHFDFLPSKEDYYQVLEQSDIVISTSLHEFFGVAMIEAAYYGAYPLCPNRLVYPEIFSSEHLFQNDEDLYQKLKGFLLCSESPKHKAQIDFTLYDWKFLRSEYLKILG